jgi:hypothetical protein
MTMLPYFDFWANRTFKMDNLAKVFLDATVTHSAQFFIQLQTKDSSLARPQALLNSVASSL